MPSHACRRAHHAVLPSRRAAPAPTLANIMGWASSSAPRSGLGMACAHSPLSGDGPASPRLWDTSLALHKDRGPRRTVSTCNPWKAVPLPDEIVSWHVWHVASRSTSTVIRARRP